MQTIEERCLGDDCKAAAVSTALELGARSRAALGRSDEKAFRAIQDRKKHLVRQANKALLAAFEGREAVLALGRWTAPHALCSGDPVDLAIKRVDSDPQKRLALTDLVGGLRDAGAAAGVQGRYARALSVAARAATAAATNFPGPCWGGRGAALVRLRRCADAGIARPVVGVAQALADGGNRTARAVEACELEAAASISCRRTNDRDAAEDYLASLTARVAGVSICPTGLRYWRLLDGAPLHVLTERCHLTLPGTFRALKNATQLVEQAALLRERAGPPSTLSGDFDPRLPAARFLEPLKVVGAAPDAVSDKLQFSARWLRKACLTAIRVAKTIEPDDALCEAAARCCVAAGAVPSANGLVDLLRATCRATPNCAKAWFELGRWTELKLNGSFVDAACLAYARCLEVGGTSSKLAAVAGARLVADAGDADSKGLDALADATPTAAWVAVAPQLLGAAFEKTPNQATSATSFSTRPWFRLLRRVALERPQVLAHAVVVACREAKRDKAALLEDGTTKGGWFRGGAATRTLRAELALSGEATRAMLNGAELLVDELHAVATLPEDRWCLALSRRTCNELREAQHILRKELCRSLMVFTDSECTPVPEKLNKERLEELIDAVLFKRRCVAGPFLKLLDKACDELLTEKNSITDHTIQFQHLARCAVAAARESLESPPRSVVREWCRGDRITGVDGFGGAIDAFAKLRGDDVQTWSCASVAPRLSQGFQPDISIRLPVACTSSSSVLHLTGSVRALRSRTRPKKIHVACDDGRTRAFLLKGREDVHLDARVMQLLESVEWSAKASINRYAVLPLSRSSGLIEWVPRTTPLFTLYDQAQKNRRLTKAIALRQKRLNEEQEDSATNKKGRRRPRSPRPKKTEELERDAAPAHLFRVATRNLDPTKRSEWDPLLLRSAYDALSADAPHDLIDRALCRQQSTCHDWVWARRTYADSLGTSVIVAHALGLGDRHLDNVLLDPSAGKLIDVDWGVCFDAGRRLRVPEKVPFRLTPCVARPLGPEGPRRNGVFLERAKKLASLLSGDAGKSLLDLLALCCRDARVEWRATRGPARQKHKDRDEGAAARGVLALAAARLWEDRRQLRVDALKRAEAVKACLDARYASAEAAKVPAKDDGPDECELLRPKQAELAYATKEAKRTTLAKREAERSRADASDALYESRGALERLDLVQAESRLRRSDVRARLAQPDAGSTLMMLAATLRAAAAGAPGVPEPNLDVLRQLFEAHPRLRDVVAALRDDNLLGDGIRAARDQVLATGSMFANGLFSSEKEDMRALEAIHAALLTTPPDPRPACRDAALALERAADALRGATPLVHKVEEDDVIDGDVFADATGREQCLVEAEARRDLARDLVDGVNAPLRPDRLDYALRLLDDAKAAAKKKAQDQLYCKSKGDAFVGALKSLRRALDATDPLDATTARPHQTAQQRCARAVARLREVDAAESDDNALVDAACAARAALDDADVGDAACLNDDDRAPRIAARLDALRDAAVGLGELLDEYGGEQNAAFLGHVQRGCDAAKRVSRDAARLFAASALGRAAATDELHDRARAWRIHAAQCASDEAAWGACLEDVVIEAPDDAMLLQALEALWGPLEREVRAAGAELDAEALSAARRGLLAARELGGDRAEHVACAALSAAAAAGARPLERLLEAELESFSATLPASASRSDAAVCLTAVCACAQLRHQLGDRDALNMILQHLQRRCANFELRCDELSSRRGVEVTQAAHAIQAQAQRPLQGAAFRALQRCRDRLHLGEAAQQSIAGARQALENGLHALDGAQPFGALGLLDELQPRVPVGDGSWARRIDARRESVLEVRRWLGEAIQTCDVATSLSDLGGVGLAFEREDANDATNALNQAQAYMNAGSQIGDAADAAHAAAQARLAGLRERERKATASKGALGNAARKVRFAKRKLRERQAGDGRIWSALRQRTADLRGLFVDEVAAAEAFELEARFFELERADASSSKLVITEGEAVVLAVEDLEAFEKGQHATKTLPFHRQRVDSTTRVFGEKAEALVDATPPPELGEAVRDLKAIDRTGVSTLIARLLRLADRGALGGLALDDAVARDLKRAPPLSSLSDSDDEDSQPASPRAPATTREKAAEDALATTREKLATYADAATVDGLVATATDPAVLCHMYEGWAPWV